MNSSFQSSTDISAALKERPGNETIIAGQAPASHQSQRKATQASAPTGLASSGIAASTNQSGVVGAPVGSGDRQYRGSRLPAPSTRVTRGRVNATSSTVLVSDDAPATQMTRNGDSDLTQHSSIATDICKHPYCELYVYTCFQFQ